MAIPLIFIHYGNSDSLFYALWQAKQTNPESRIVLLGDRQNAHFQWLLNIEHYFIQVYSDEAKQSLKHYVHLSTNGEEFERFCLERWFILHTFLCANPDLQPCVYLDSDILLYDALDVPADDLKAFGMTMVAFSAHTNFVRCASSLKAFCQFIQAHYDDPSLQKGLQEQFTQFLAKQGAGGISDMTFFQQFRHQYPDQIATLCMPMGQPDHLYAFDERIDTDYGGYELEKGWKKIIWINNIPHCKNILNDQLVKLLTLHFQGVNKQRMIYFINHKTSVFAFKKLLNRVHIYSGKTKKRFRSLREYLKGGPL